MTIEKSIQRNRETRDYDLYIIIDGGAPQYIGSASTYGQGEVITNNYAYEYLTHLDNACGGWGCVDTCGDCGVAA